MLQISLLPLGCPVLTLLGLRDGPLDCAAALIVVLALGAAVVFWLVEVVVDLSLVRMSV